MKKICSVLVIVLVFTLQGCSGTNALALGYAFRKAENTALQNPILRNKITNPQTQMQINALEGEFDSGWNCAFVAYEAAAKNTPEGAVVKVTTADFKPCLGRSFSAAFQILNTIRTFDPNFLTAPQDVKTSNGITLSYDPGAFTSSDIPSSVALHPSDKSLVGAK